MTPEDLLRLIDAEDSEGCLTALAALTETQRRKLAKTAVASLKELTAGSMPWMPRVLAGEANPFAMVAFPEIDTSGGKLRPARLAVLATATWPQVRSFGVRSIVDPEDAVAVFAARRPPWVSDWAEGVLTWGESDRSVYDLVERWQLVRHLVCAGLCAAPTDARFVVGMILGLAARAAVSEMTIQQNLLDNPELLADEFWRFFEIEASPASHDALDWVLKDSTDQGWTQTLAAMARTGQIDRTRLLDACLSGLDRDLGGSQARWFARLHETLQPIPGERELRTKRYLSLLASRNPSTVGFALNALGQLGKAGRLESRPLLDAAVPVLRGRTKTPLLRMLKLIGNVVECQPSSRSRAALVAVEALTHESPDIHKAVLDLIERCGDPHDATLVELLCDRMDAVAASQRARLVEWLGLLSEPGVVSAIDPALGLGALQTRAGTLDPALARLTGVDTALATVERGGGDPPAAPFAITDAPRLDPARRIEPVADLDELIALFARMIETDTDPDDLERLLDGVSRLADQAPIDFDSRTAPLRVRAVERIEFAPLVPSWLSILAISWVDRKDTCPGVNHWDQRISRLLTDRFRAVARRVASRRATTLLSAPTHHGGWIDPRVLIDRIRAWESSDDPVDPIDAALAILRLAPDLGPRRKALQAAADLSGPVAAACRYALGGEGQTIGPEANLWIAAARARDPLRDDLLVDRTHPDLGPDGARAARFVVRVGDPVLDPTPVDQRLIVTPEPHPIATLDFTLPSVLLQTPMSWWISESWWVVAFWPMGRESLAGIACPWFQKPRITPRQVAEHRPLLEVYRDPDVPLGLLSRLLVVSALACGAPELRGLATDIVIAALDDGRLDGDSLGEASGHLVAQWLAPCSRLAKSLAVAASITPFHARAVARSIERILAMVISTPKDIHTLLELLGELSVEVGEGFTIPAATEYLQRVEGTGKSASLARTLLARKPADEPASRLESAIYALAGRVDRAERWARISGDSD